MTIAIAHLILIVAFVSTGQEPLRPRVKPVSNEVLQNYSHNYLSF